ncbi:MAG: NUDIX hydrolase [Thermoanaerobaculia bacterium]
MRILILLAPLLAATATPAPFPVKEVLAKTETIRLAPDLSGLTVAEQSAVKDLLEAGQIFQDLYETSKHHQALEARAALAKSGDKDLRSLYWLNNGPIGTTLTNTRLPIVPAVDPEVPGKNVYPIGITRAEVDAFLAAHPAERGSILGERTVVRRATKANLDRDLATLAKHPAISVLQPGMQQKLRALKADSKILYAVPYSVAYAGSLMKAYGLLNRAAGKLEASDDELAGYLRNRARDLIANDYESGDASWVTGRFARLNAQIGSYETYDDALYGTKAFHAFSLLSTNEKATNELRGALGGLQEIENVLPYEHHKRVRDDISVGVYNVIADFGQARGTNTATILPNDALYSARYGRTILLRENIMRHPLLFAADLRIWRSALADAHANDLTDEGNFQRTLWHEIGHYLGVDRDKDGRSLDVALQDQADALEEMKSDLVSLFALHRMNHPGLRTIQASGIRRTLQNVKPRKDQPYQTMQLAQFNYFLENGLLAADPQTARLTVDYDRYRDVVTSLLREVLTLQRGGDRDAAARFFERYGAWIPELHEKLATHIREAQGNSRFRIVRYEALGQ